MRAFVAIEIPARVRRAVEERLGACGADRPPARWVATRNLHLTLVFLGEIEDSRASAVAARLGAVFERSAAFDLQLEDGGWFPAGRPARVLWLGLAPAPDLVRLQRGVARVCRKEVGSIDDRAHYAPHLTVARCRRPWPRAAARRWREEVAGPTGSAFRVEEGVLMQSRLTPQGAGYEPYRRLPLGAAE